MLSASEEVIVTEGVTIGLTVVVMELLVAVGVAKQVSSEVITTETVCPFVSEVVVKVFEAVLLPTLLPLTRHWYKGEVPPLIGVAVNVTELPAQIVLSASSETIDTVGVKLGLTVIGISELTAVAEVTQVKLEVNSTDTS